MPASTLLMGQGNAPADPGAALWRFGDGADDAGTAYDFLAESNWLPVDGEAMEYVFFKCFLTLTWSMDVTIRVTPEVDQEGLTEAAGTLDFTVFRPVFTLAAPISGRHTQTFEIPFELVVFDADVEKIRQAIRGTRLRLLLESVGGLGEGNLTVDGFRLELEPQQESIGSESE